MYPFSSGSSNNSHETGIVIFPFLLIIPYKPLSFISISPALENSTTSSNTEGMTSFAVEFKNPNFMILGRGRSETEKSIIQIDKGKYVGFGYFEPEYSGQDTDSLKDFVKYKEDNKDVNRILKKYLVNSESKNIVPY